MWGGGALTFREFVMHEPLPLASIHEALLGFLRGRDDAALFGAQAVNAYVDEPRMTQDVDILSVRAADLAEEIRTFLVKRFRIAARVRRVRGGLGYRIYQVHRPRNRHLADVRSVETLPPVRRIGNIRVLAPADLIAMKVVAYANRQGQPKSGTDWRDLAMLLLAFPELKESDGEVRARLRAAGADSAALAAWRHLASQAIRPEAEW
jgi:hypothetical protein